VIYYGQILTKIHRVGERIKEEFLSHLDQTMFKYFARSMTSILFVEPIKLLKKDISSSPRDN